MYKAKRRIRPKGRYDEHHILPRCLDGNENKSNLVNLTPEEHYVAHQLLVKIYPGNGKLIFAALAMTGSGNGIGNGRKGNKLYGWLRKAFVDNQIGRKHSEETKRKIGQKTSKRIKENGHPLLGKKHSPEALAKMSAAKLGKVSKLKGRPKSKEHCKKLSESKKLAFANGECRTTKGYKHTDAARAKMSAKRKIFCNIPANKEKLVATLNRRLHV